MARCFCERHSVASVYIRAWAFAAMAVYALDWQSRQTLADGYFLFHYKRFVGRLAAGIGAYDVPHGGVLDGDLLFVNVCRAGDIYPVSFAAPFYGAPTAVTKPAAVLRLCLWPVCSVWGCITPIRPVVRHQTVFINKKMDKPLRIGVASDLHLGILFGARQLDKLTDIMKQEQVDMVLLPGDLMDDTVDAYLKENMKPHLQKLTAPMGVYATLGNHDWFRDQKRIKHELEAAGLTVLANQVLEVNGVLLVGRSDDLDRKRPVRSSFWKVKIPNYRFY